MTELEALYAPPPWPPAGFGGCRICGRSSDEVPIPSGGTVCQPCWDWARSFRPGRTGASRPVISLRAQLDLAVSPLGKGRVTDAVFRHFETSWRYKPARVKVDDCGTVSVRRGVRIRGAHSGETDHPFRWQTDHLFRRKPITRSDANRSPVGAKRRGTKS